MQLDPVLMDGAAAQAVVPVRIRASTEADLQALAAIVADHVASGVATFEERAPDPAIMAERRLRSIGAGLPHLVAVDGEGRVLGFAAAIPFRERSAYRLTVEDSIYVARAAQGMGVGRALLEALIEETGRLGLHQMIAVVGDARNSASIGLHRAIGFEACGWLREAGFKPGSWVDVVLLQRSLGAAGTPPGRA